MKAKLKTLRLRMALIGLCSVFIVFGLMSGSVLADDDKLNYEEYKKKEAQKQLPPHERPHKAEPPKGGHENLAASATNPIANLIQFQTQNQYNWDNHNSSGYSNSFIIQPVIPFKLPWKKVPTLVTRTTLPYVSTPDLGDPVGRRHGFGDLTILAIATTTVGEKNMFGVGTSLVFPTAGDNEFTGSGKYQAGPAVAYINLATPKTQWGFLGWHQWSYASHTGGRRNVSKSFLQPFLIRHFNKGWYAGTPDVPQVYDFKEEKWTWALGPRVGRVMKLGKLPVNMFGQVTYNPEDDAGPTPKWTAKFNLTLLFPK
jgi:hypothetical protein